MNWLHEAGPPRVYPIGQEIVSVVHIPVNLEAHIVAVASEEVADEGGTI
jgi:hypothetical protein